MNRAVWFAAGAGLGVYAVTRARRMADALTPEGLADRLAGLSLGAQLFRDEVRTGMAEKENDLRARLHRTPHGTPAQIAGTPAAPEEQTTREGND